jgi:hypothetical protein
MTKYYRVRTQEQWEWLMRWFEKDKATWSLAEYRPTQFNCPKEINEPIIRQNEDKSFDVFDVNSVTMPDTIEVSDPMEESKMEDYVTIKGEDVEKLKNEQGDSLFFMSDKQHFAYSFIEGFDCSEVNNPKSLLYPKVRMSVAEKKEFDELKNYSPLLSVVMERVDTSGNKYQHLYSKLFNQETTKEDVQAQNEFARAWAGPSLIEVIPEDKYWVKCYPTDDCYFYKYEGKILAGVPRVHLERFQFTTDEIVEYHLDGTENIFEKVEVSE